MLFETLLVTKWHKMKGWLWKADREGDTGIQRRQRARLGFILRPIMVTASYKRWEEREQNCSRVEKKNVENDIGQKGLR